MIKDQIHERLVRAMKAQDALEKGILRVALGEIQSAEATQGRALADEEAAALLRKLVKSARESLELAGQPAHRAKLEGEIAVLAALLPKTLDEAGIVEALAVVRDEILGARNDGQATGIAMKHLKAAGLAVMGQDVARAVARMRA